ncbi:MAG: hypothetical protein GX774_15895 [Armatimonadetes bacterium]|jgi:hypothetical protein|nr:hypothetical protein [Armatimonadota bacterium]
MTRLKKLLLTALGLLVVAVVVNLTDPTRSLVRLAKRETTVQAQVAQRFGTPKELRPYGNESAKVKLIVYVQSTNHCHQPTVTMCQRIAKAVPKRVRVEFVDTITPEGAKAAKQKFQCETGILVNGTPMGGHGPIGGGTPAHLLRAAVENALAKQYAQGLPAEESTRLALVFKDLPTAGMGPGLPGGKDAPAGKAGKPKGSAPTSPAAPDGKKPAATKSATS